MSLKAQIFEKRHGLQSCEKREYGYSEQINHARCRIKVRHAIGYEIPLKELLD
jgi:hypothetical protein